MKRQTKELSREGVKCRHHRLTGKRTEQCGKRVNHRDHGVKMNVKELYMGGVNLFPNERENRKSCPGKM